MEKRMKKIIFILITPIALMILSVFFNRKYLKGLYFEKSFIGYKWAIRSILWQKIFGFNRKIPWPVSPFIVISNPNNIVFDIADLNNFQGIGNYFQNFSGKIIIGKGTYIASNVGIITANHDLMDPDKHLPGKDVVLGEYCWIGMNSVILPGVILGNHTVVGAGSIVTKSFIDGNCVLAGNPAVVIKNLTDNSV